MATTDPVEDRLAKWRNEIVILKVKIHFLQKQSLLRPLTTKQYKYKKLLERELENIQAFLFQGELLK